MKSILQSEKECYLSGRTDWLEEHHIFYGQGRRKLSVRLEGMAQSLLAQRAADRALPVRRGAFQPGLAQKTGTRRTTSV